MSWSGIWMLPVPLSLRTMPTTLKMLPPMRMGWPTACSVGGELAGAGLGQDADGGARVDVGGRQHAAGEERAVDQLEPVGRRAHHAQVQRPLAEAALLLHLLGRDGALHRGDRGRECGLVLVGEPVDAHASRGGCRRTPPRPASSP